MQSLLKTLIFQCYISLLEPIPIPWEAAQEILQHKNTEAVKRTLFVWPPKRFFFCTLYFSRYCENRFPYGTPYYDMEPPNLRVTALKVQEFSVENGQGCHMPLWTGRLPGQQRRSDTMIFCWKPIGKPSFHILVCKGSISLWILEIYAYIRRGLI